MHLCLCAVRIVDRRKAIALYFLLRRLQRRILRRFWVPPGNSKKTITDHSRNFIVILYIVFILNMVNILKVCTCNQKFIFAPVYCKLLFFMFVCIDCYLQIVKSCTDWTDCTFCLSIQKNPIKNDVPTQNVLCKKKKTLIIGELHAFEVLVKRLHLQC